MDKKSLPIISSIENLKFLPKDLSENDIVCILSDLKHRVFPRPFERLGFLGKKNLIGVEIGVAGGEHALSMLQTLDIKKLYLIDPYELYDEYFEGKSHYGIDQMPLSETEKNAREKLFDYKDQIVWVRKLSSDAIAEIIEPLDFVYVDGNHEEKFVTEDIKNYGPLLKKHGIIGGHDYYNGFQKEHDDVVRVVTTFATELNVQLNVELPDWWFEYPK